MMSLNNLALGLQIDKSRVSRIIRDLNITPHKKRGPSRQWEHFFDTEQIDRILEHRRGIPHNLVKDKNGYKVR